MPHWPRVAAFIAGTFIIASSVEAAPITVEYTDTSGRKWAALVDTVNLSWNQLNAACSTDGATPCHSDVGAVETTGWIWANQDQVRELFYELGLPPASLDDYFHLEPGSTWAPAALATFSATQTNAGVYAHFYGWLSTLKDPTSGFAAVIHDRVEPAENDIAQLNGFAAVDDQISFVGAWLFRPAVPEPAALLLFATAAGVLKCGRRRR
jgi:hypothetical protein